MSDYEEREGRFDFNATSLAPPGCKIYINKKTDARITSGTTWCRRVLHWYGYISWQMPPCVKKIHKRWMGWRYVRFILTTYKNYIYVFCQLNFSGWFLFNLGVTRYQSWITICKHWWNPVVRPKKTCNPVSILHEQTWWTSKGVTDIANANCNWYITTKGGT